ncbi:MAG: hypothetical protein ACJAYG_000790 [Oceanicoccus sp.]|jgi:hypothetical protein
MQANNISSLIDNLQHSILWAQQQDDMEVLCLARDNMDQLMSVVDSLPLADQLQAHYHIDQVLPMEWPLWMEACRYDDGSSRAVVTLH